MLRGDLQSAKRVLSEAAARDRLAFWPRALLADALLNEGKNLAAAERTLREVLAINPDYSPARQKLAQLLQQRDGGGQ